MSLDDAVVVEAQQRDHVPDVALVLDRAGGGTRSVGEHGVGSDPALRSQLVPDALREAEVRRVVAVQVADLAPADAEGERAEIARVAWTPGQDVTSSAMTRLAGRSGRTDSDGMSMESR